MDKVVHFEIRRDMQLDTRTGGTPNRPHVLTFVPYFNPMQFA
jgi:hypothetical protein